MIREVYIRAGHTLICAPLVSKGARRLETFLTNSVGDARMDACNRAHIGRHVLPASAAVTAAARGDDRQPLSVDRQPTTNPAATVAINRLSLLCLE
jgi:hypothetical protein